jgi:hypothetical protein
VAPDDRFERAIAAIDAANAGDPNTIELRGEVHPKELAHAELMTEWVRRLDPGADEPQLLAARASHLRRWSLPRSSHPEGRAGYLRWRTALRKQHAAEVAALLAGVGYDDATVERVQAIVGKVRLGTDPAVQVHEDALCLVFLETQLGSTADQLGDDKIVDVVRKTAAKMSPAGLAAAATLHLGAREQALLERALSEPGGASP